MGDTANKGTAKEATVKESTDGGTTITEQEIAEGTETGTPIESPPERYGYLLTSSRDQDVLHPPRDEWKAAAEALFEDNWTMLVDITAVDYLTYIPQRILPFPIEAERFEVVANFVRFDTGARIRMRTQVPESDPRIQSLYATFPGSDYQERETYDMFGIVFEGHPDLSRILMPEHWVGHPLRKDFAQGAIPVQFKSPNQTARKDRGTP